MGTSTGDVVDVAWLRTLMTDAVRQAGTGTARFAENTGEWEVEISFDLSGNPPERRIRGLHEAGSEVFVMGDNVRSSTAATAHFWDSRRAEGSACGDPVRLIASLPDGSASVVRHSPATTTYELVADQQALADFCEQAHWPSDQPGLGATLATRWSVDAEGRPVSVAAADGRLDFPWDAIAFSDWGSPVEWATPPDLPAWQMTDPA